MHTTSLQKQTSRASQAYKKLEEFSGICDAVGSCVLCARMRDSARILSLSSGSLAARILFIGEAPGRLGADSTGIPFHGDKAGDNFENLLDFVGISREDIFVTNAVLCNPRDENGNNATPIMDEIINCSRFLKGQIALINPSIVVTLGANALKATGFIEPHGLTLRNDVRTNHQWYGRALIPLYHPGQRAMIHRSLANQRSDYQFVSDQLKRLGIKPRTVRGKTADSVAEVIKIILDVKGEVSYFALHKLLYLVEWAYMCERNMRLTGAYFIRQKDGPYCTDLHLMKLKSALPELQIKNHRHKLYLRLPERDLFNNDFENKPKGELENFVHTVVKQHYGKSDSELKTRVYLTSPMRDILRREKDKAENLYNVPILIGW